MICILFGEMGVGKNHIGELIAKHLNCKFFDGDDVIPEKMLEKARNFKSLSRKDIDEFIFSFLFPEICKRIPLNGDLVVAQALYGREHRKRLVKRLEDYITQTNLNNQVKLIWIKAPSFFVHIKHLLSRNNGFKWVKYFLTNKLFFQKPDKVSLTIISKSYSEILNQFMVIECVEILESLAKI